MVRFGFVGVANTMVTLGVFALLAATGAPGPAASAVAFCAGSVNSFLLNRRWTFSGIPLGRGGAVRFALIQGLGAGLSAGGVALLEVTGLSHLEAECVTLPCVTISLYALLRLLVFRAATI